MLQNTGFLHLRSPTVLLTKRTLQLHSQQITLNNLKNLLTGDYSLTLPGAVAKATREFVKGLDRKQRFDMNKSGLEIKATSVTSSGGADQNQETAKSATQAG